jgi:hypothetical protein
MRGKDGEKIRGGKRRKTGEGGGGRGGKWGRTNVEIGEKKNMWEEM